jgi:hypothetical protein
MFLMPVLPIVLIGTILIGGVLDRRGVLGAPGRMVEVTAPLAVIAAALSLAAAGIHFAVIGAHLEQNLAEGLFFFALAWFQALWAQAYLLRAARAIAAVGVAVNAGVVAIWLVSRTIGLPFGAQPGVAEPVGLADLMATSLEIGLVGLLLPTLARQRFEGWLTTELPVQKAFVLATFTIATLALLTGLALVPDVLESISL